MNDAEGRGVEVEVEEVEEEEGDDSPHPCCATKGGASRNSLCFPPRLKAYLN